MILRFTLVAVLTFESSSTHTAKSLVGKTALTGGVVLAMVFNACALKPKRRNMYHHDENKLVGNWLFSDLSLSFKFIRLIDKTKLETKGCLVCYTVTMIIMIKFIRLIDKTKVETKGCLVCYTVTMIIMMKM